MQDSRQVLMSTEGYQAWNRGKQGQGLHWTCDIRDELPIKMQPSGEGSQTPRTMCEVFAEAVLREGDKPAMHLQRDGKEYHWSWNEFYYDTRRFSKALAKLNVTARSAVAVMGFNSPEWVMTFMGAICYNTVITGVYITNEPDACLYQANHASAEIVVVDSIDRLRRFAVNKEKMPQIF